jgi:ferrochelatase
MSTPSNPKAVLLMAYGSPETVEEVGAYYTHIRGGVRPSEELITEVEDRYRLLGGKTPLVEITRQQAAALQKMLNERTGVGTHAVYVGMKHWHPYIKDILAEISIQHPSEEVIALALAPHYSKISIGGYQKALEEAKQDLTITMIESWHTNPHLITCIREQLQDALDKNPIRPHIVFSAHSLPQRIREWNDPYESQLLETSGLVAEHFPDHEWTFSFQSAGHTADPWLGPDILDHLVDLKNQGKDNILICPVGLVTK